MIWCVETFGWTPAQVRQLTQRDFLLLAEAQEAKPKPRRR